MKPVLALVLFFTALLPLELHALEIEVTRLSGRVTQQRSSDPAPRRLSLQDRVGELTIFETGDNGVLALRFPDGTALTLGRSTRLSIQAAGKGKTGLLTLHFGRLRVATKNPEKGILYLGTNEAVLSVKSGEFHLLRFDETQRTTVLAYEGEVTLGKNFEGQRLREAMRDFLSREQANVLERTRTGEIEFRRDVTPSDRRRFRVEALLNQPEAVHVHPGEFSVMLAALDFPTTPQRISTAQFNALYNNRELQRPTPEDTELLPSAELAVAPVVQWLPSQVQPEGEIHLARRILAPKAGGFLDLITGIYVSPEEDASYYEAFRIYVPRNIGGIDRNTGFYLPPEGHQLSYAGFTGNRASELNRSLSYSLGGQVSELSRKTTLSLRELLTKNTLTVNLRPFTQTFKSTETYKSKLGMGYDFSLSHGSSNRWQFEHNLRLRNLEFKAPDTVVNDYSWLFGMSFGTRFFLVNRLSLLLDIGVEQDYFIESTEASNVITTKFARVNSTKLRALTEWQIIRSNNASLSSTFGAIYHFGRTNRELVTDSTAGFYADLLGHFWLGRRFSIQTGPWMMSHSQKVTDRGQEISTTRSSVGGLLGFNYLY
jgi:hypothetical protein